MIIRFWDDLYICKRDCDIRLGRFERGDVALVHDNIFEKGGTIYHNIFKDMNGNYQMYYMAICKDDAPDMRVMSYNSRDGLNWDSGSFSIIANRHSIKGLDNYFCFYDKKEDIIRAVFQEGKGLYTINEFEKFKDKRLITTEGAFDTLNTCFYDEKYECYRCYFRGFHDGIRDIRTIESKDFITWSKPYKLLYHGDPTDYHLYTNNIMPYDDIYIGLPTRYVERDIKNANYIYLPEHERRRQVMRKELRFGTAMTDLLFMYSYDGDKWIRFDEAIIRPDNYMYGDCYMAYGYVGENEHTFYMLENHNTSRPCQLRQYTIKKNRFMSMHAGDKICTIKTKPLKLWVNLIYLNFKTSAAGWVEISCNNIESGYKLIGDSTRQEVQRHKDWPIEGCLTIRFKDADIYSLEV